MLKSEEPCVVARLLKACSAHFLRITFANADADG